MRGGRLRVPPPGPALPLGVGAGRGVWRGALAMGGWGLASYLRLRRRLFDAIRAPDGAWEHPSVGSPFILGVFRPRIYLPAGLRGQPRQFILCHERAHLRRLDHLVKPLCWLALALHWFNPAVWLAFVLMGRDMEAACDEAVIRTLGPAVKADYSATLLSLATGGRIPAPCPLAFDEGDAKGRIHNVLRYQRPTLWIVVVSVVMALMAAVCLLTDPVSAKSPDPEDDQPPAAGAQSPEPSPLPTPSPAPQPTPAPEAKFPVMEPRMDRCCGVSGPSAACTATAGTSPSMKCASVSMGTWSRPRLQWRRAGCYPGPGRRRAKRMVVLPESLYDIVGYCPPPTGGRNCRFAPGQLPSAI